MAADGTTGAATARRTGYLAASTTTMHHIEDVASCGRVGHSAAELPAAHTIIARPTTMHHSSSWSSLRSSAAAVVATGVSAVASAAVFRTAAATVLRWEAVASATATPTAGCYCCQTFKTSGNGGI